MNTGFAKAYRVWVENRLGTVTCLAEKRGYYVADASVILGALVGALSSDAFERGAGDKKRFIELLVNSQTAGPNPPFSTISLVSIDNALPEALPQNYKDRIDVALSNGSSDVPTINANALDTFSDVELCKITGLCLKDVRKHSYANIFYEHLRCSYLHEYRGEALLLPDTGAASPNIVMYNARKDIFFSLQRSADIIKAIGESLANNAPHSASDKKMAEIRFQTPSDFWCDG